MQTKEFKLKNEAEIALSNDEGACKLVKEFQNLKKAFDRMQIMGYALTKKNEMKLQELEEKALKHPLIKDWHEKAQKFYDLASEVNKKIYEGIYE